jgi:two-component system, cell cycle sensor histidine kinase and response regulator CckA
MVFRLKSLTMGVKGHSSFRIHHSSFHNGGIQMNTDPAPSYEELKQRLAAAESALAAVRADQTDVVAGDGNTPGGEQPAESGAREAHLKNVLLAIRNVNQLIVYVEDPKQLAEQACRNLVETMGYYNAWIALLDRTHHVVTITSDAGFNGGFGPMRERLLRGGYPDCLRKTMDRKGLVAVEDPVSQCPDCPLSIKYQGRAGLIHRLEFQGCVYGIISVSVPASYVHDAEEHALFNELAEDLAFALHKIDVLTEKAGIESALRRSHAMLMRTEAIAHVGSWEWEIGTDRVTWSDELFRIFGRDPALGAPSFSEHPRFYVHEDMERLKEAVAACVSHGRPYEIELRAVRVDGEIRHCIARGMAQKDENGQIARLVGSLQDLTERRRQEERIALLGRMIDEAPASITIHDTDGRFLFANRRTFSLHGYNEEEFMAINLHDLDLPESEALLEERFRRIAEEEEATFEVEHFRKDGTAFPLRVYAKKVDWEGRPAILSIASDITEEKQAEQALAQSERSYRDIFDNSTDCIFIHDAATGVIVDVNRTTCKIFGYSADEIKRLNVGNFSLNQSPYTNAEAVEWIRKARMEGPQSFEWLAKNRRGRLIWFENTLLLARIGGKDRVLVFGHNISDRKQAELELRESETRFKEYVNNAPYGIFITDDAGRYLDVNPMASVLIGYTREELLTMSIPDILTPEMQNIGMAHFASLKATGRAFADIMFRRKDGSVLWWTVNAVRLSGDRYIGFCQDITEQKQAEAEKEKLQTQLIQAQKMESVGRLAGGVAHDFNNMLAVILGHGEMALEKINPGDPLDEDLKEIMTAARRSADLTGQLLAFARKQTIAPTLLDLNDTVADMLKMFRRLIGEDINLAWEPGAGLWPVMMDPSQIHQILANLCVNARDAIAGIGKVVIETENKRLDETFGADHADFDPGDYVMLAVSDDGCGMDKATLANLFEPFFTTKEVGEGTGLGLATIYGIVKQNKGFINVHSEPDKGSSFRIYLPRHAVAVQPAEAGPKAEIPRGRGETILVVEDEASILTLARKMLTRLGYQVLTAPDPTSALKLAGEQSESIHLLMTDVVMPEMNGRDLAGRLKTRHPDLKILFMSGYTANVIAHRGILEEGVHFIQKPFSRADLALKVREALLE